MEEWWWGEFVKKNTGLDWWYQDDTWVISSRYHLDITHTSPTYHPDDITHISSIYHPYIIQKLSIYYTYHPNITHISSKYHPYITHISFKYHSVVFLNLVKSQVLTQIWHDYCRKKLHFEIRLKLHFSSSRYYPNIIQISSRNHPEIIQKSSKNHPEIIQISSSRHRFVQPPNLVKSRVFIQIWQNYCRWKLHFWKAKVEFNLILTRVFVC